jgi:molecular chaperone GrpE
MKKNLDEKKYEDLYKRALADYQNLEKRIGGEKEEFVKFANAELILQILPGLDSLEKAEKHLQDEGLSLAVKQLKDGLAKVGLEEISVLGLEYNPETMECLATGEGEENKVIEELRKGYLLNGKILRPALVRVGKKKEDKKQ